MKLIGERIRNQRLELGYTQEYLGKLCKLNKDIISRLENDEYKTHSKNVKPQKLADALECTVDYLLGTSNSPFEYSDKKIMPFSMSHTACKRIELYELVEKDIQLAEDLIYMQTHFSTAEITLVKQLLSLLRKNHEQVDALTPKKPSSR